MEDFKESQSRSSKVIADLRVENEKLRREATSSATALRFRGSMYDELQAKTRDLEKKVEETESEKKKSDEEWKTALMVQNRRTNHFAEKYEKVQK